MEETYNVVGNGNEYGLVIGETTFDGVRILAEQPGAIIDYGSMIYLTLQRAKTAREAIETMSNLMGECGLVVAFVGALECRCRNDQCRRTIVVIITQFVDPPRLSCALRHVRVCLKRRIDVDCRCFGRSMGDGAHWTRSNISQEGSRVSTVVLSRPRFSALCR